MATNDEIILKLMQHVSDELDNISTKVNRLEQSKERNEIFLARQRELLNENIQATNKAFREVLEENPPIIQETHHSQYILFGKDSPFSSKLLLSIITLLLVCIPMIKYVPPFFNERSALKEEKDHYKLFYDYVFLNAFEKTKTDLLKS